MWAVGLVLVLVVAARGVGLFVHPVIGTAAIVAACLGAALLTRMPPADPSFVVRIPEEPQPFPLDRRLVQLSWQVRALDGGDTWPRALQPHLAALVDERLARHHGIDRRTEPDRARELLGPELWRLVDDPHHVPRNLKALAADIERIHSL